MSRPGVLVRGQLQRLRLVPGVIWALTALFGCLLAFHSFLSPIGGPPDEHTHADLVLHLASGASYPDYDERRVGRAALTAAYTFRCCAFPLTPERVEAGDAEATFVELGGDGPTETAPWNQMPQHPPLYYLIASSWLRGFRWLLGENRSLIHEWHVVRFLSVLVLTPVPLLSWLSARRLKAAGGAALAAAVFPLAVPQLAHVGASINNDSLLVLLGSLLSVSVAGLLVGRHNDRTAVVMGIVTGLALLTKAFAIAFPMWIVLAAVVRGWGHRKERRVLARELAIAGAIALVVSGWWWIGRVVRHGTPFVSVQNALLRESYDPVTDPDFVWFVQRFSAWMTRRFWGHFGWFELELGTGFVAGAMLVSTLALVVAIAPQRGFRASPTTAVRRIDAAVFGSVVLVLLAMVFVNALGLYLDTGRTQFMQGRYLFAAIVPLGVLIGMGLHELLDRWAPSTMLVAAGVLQIESARLILRNWWAEPNASARRSLSAMVAWNQWPVPLVGIVAAGIVVSGVLAMGGLVAQARAGPAAARSSSR